MVRTSGFQPENRSSILLGGTNKSNELACRRRNWSNIGQTMISTPTPEIVGIVNTAKDDAKTERRSFKLGNKTAEAGPHIVNLRCPLCRHAGAFHGVGVNDLQWSSGPEIYKAGMRRCPTQECSALVFVVTASGRVLRSYPAETIDFDSARLPSAILATLEEAIKCHAIGSYRAASSWSAELSKNSA